MVGILPQHHLLVGVGQGWIVGHAAHFSFRVPFVEQHLHTVLIELDPVAGHVVGPLPVQSADHGAKQGIAGQPAQRKTLAQQLFEGSRQVAHQGSLLFPIQTRQQGMVPSIHKGIDLLRLHLLQRDRLKTSAAAPIDPFGPILDGRRPGSDHIPGQGIGLHQGLQTFQQGLAVLFRDLVHPIDQHQGPAILQQPLHPAPWHVSGQKPGIQSGPFLGAGNLPGFEGAQTQIEGHRVVPTGQPSHILAQLATAAPPGQPAQQG